MLHLWQCYHLGRRAERWVFVKFSFFLETKCLGERMGEALLFGLAAIWKE